jgi:hypothetical protein
MKKPADEILFASINLPIIDKSLAAKEILALGDELSYWNDYRHTKMIPLMTKGGQGQKQGSDNKREGDFDWTSYAPQVIIDWFEDYVFPWLGGRYRVMALITQPGEANNEHIDCDRDELNTLQHKFRIVLQGNTNTLYWLTRNGNVAAPDTEKAFIMDGGWPHGMINTTDEIKVTLALGAPWIGNETYGDDITILQRRQDHLMPKDIDHLWQK